MLLIKKSAVVLPTAEILFNASFIDRRGLGIHKATVDPSKEQRYFFLPVTALRK